MKTAIVVNLWILVAMLVFFGFGKMFLDLDSHFHWISVAPVEHCDGTSPLPKAF